MNATNRERRLSPQSNKSLVPKIAVGEIMRGGKEVVILHGPAEYRLRITSTGKLILTK